MRVASLLALPALLIAGGVSADQRSRDREAAAEAKDRAAVERELTGLVPGRPLTCLPAAQQRFASSHVYGSTIIYQVSPGLKYRSDTDGPCIPPGRNPTFYVLVTETPIGQTCAGDPARTVDRDTRALAGTCNFGPFVPYRRP